MADKESRLLTPEEMQKAIIDNPDVPMGVAVKIAQDTKTLKEVGEYLDKGIMRTDNRVTKLFVLGDLVKALKRGEFPEN